MAETNIADHHPDEEIILGLVIVDPTHNRSPDAEAAGYAYLTGNTAFQYVQSAFLRAAVCLGIYPEMPFMFHAGELFYKDTHLEAVRLFGYTVDVDASDQKADLKIWATQEKPKIVVVEDGTQRIAVLSDADRGRTFVAARVTDAGLALSWDVSANAELKNDPERKGCILVLPPDAEENSSHDDESSEVRAVVDSLVHNIPAEYLKQLIPTVPPPGFGIDRRVVIETQFGEVAFSYNESKVHQMFAEFYVSRIEITTEDVASLVQRGAIEDNAKAEFLSRWMTATKRHADQALARFNDKLPQAMDDSLKSFIREVDIHGIATQKDPFVILSKNPKELFNEVRRAAGKESGYRMDMRQEVGRGPTITEEKIKRAITKLGMMANQESIAYEIEVTGKALRDWSKKQGFKNWKKAQSYYSKKE